MEYTQPQYSKYKINKFKVTILNFTRPKGNSDFDRHDTNGIKLLSRLRLHFHQLSEHKFWHKFNDTLDLMCPCGLEPEATLHYLLFCNLYSTQKLELLNNVYTLNPFPKNYQ